MELVAFLFMAWGLTFKADEFNGLELSWRHLLQLV